jgi:hypothetical protein
MVTVELAVAIPALVAVLALCLAALDLGLRQVRCDAAARTVARQLARGEAPASARRDGLRGAPDGARLIVRREGADVRVTVTAPLPAVLAPLAAVAEPRAVAVARLEQ